MKKNIALNTFIPLLLRVVTIISGFIIPRLILTHFGSSVNGLVNSVTQFLSVISFLDMGVGSVVRYNMYAPLNTGDKYKLSSVYASAQKYFRLIAKILLGYVIVLTILYPILVNSQFDALYSGFLIIVLSITSFAQYYFGQVNQILLTADQKSYISSSIQIIAIILNTILCAVLIHMGMGIHIVKLVAAVVFAVKPVILHLYVKRHYSVDNKVLYEGEPISQKWNGMAQHIASVVLEQTDVIVLTTFSILTNVSIYATYHLVINGIKMLIMSMTNGIEAYIGALIAKKEYGELEKTFTAMEWVIHTITTFVFSCTMTLIVPFVMIYTKGVDDANYNVPLFAVLITAANAGHCLRLPYSILVLAAGHYKQTQHNYIAAASMNIIISIILVNKYGLIGVAIGTIVAMLFQTVWMSWYTSKQIVKRNMLSFVKQLTIDLISAILIFSITRMFDLGSLSYISWLNLAVKCMLVSISVIMILNMLFCRDEIKKSVSALKKMQKIMYEYRGEK